MTSPTYDDVRFIYDQPHLLYDGGWITTGDAAFRVGGRSSLVALKTAFWAVAVRAQARQAVLANRGGLALTRIDGATRSATIVTRQTRGPAWTATHVQALVDGVRHGQGLLVLRSGAAVVASTVPGHQSVHDLRGIMGSTATYGSKAIWSYTRVRVVSWSIGHALAVRPPPPTLLPLDPLALVDLGHVYRGDTLILPLWQARDQRGNLLDLTNALIWFTAKQELVNPDLEPPSIQVSTEDGGIEVIDVEAAIYRVTVPPHETQELPFDAYFTFDVQAQWSSPVILTIRRGVMAVVCDVTRALA